MRYVELNAGRLRCFSPKVFYSEWEPGFGDWFSPARSALNITSRGIAQKFWNHFLVKTKLWERGQYSCEASAHSWAEIASWLSGKSTFIVWRFRNTFNGTASQTNLVSDKIQPYLTFSVICNNISNFFELFQHKALHHTTWRQKAQTASTQPRFYSLQDLSL